MITRDSFPIEGFKSVRRLEKSKVYYFYFDIEENTEEGTLECSTATIIGTYGYNDLVSKCIEAKYSIDSQLALLYNYQQDEGKYAEDMAAYQEWREYCKTACREYFGI